MGDSKRPLFAYVDETGNTGHNIFDEVQPDFYTAALITRGDFDPVFGKEVTILAGQFGQAALHGKDLGIGRLETIASDLERLLRRAKACFFVSRVEKKYLLASKLFDSIFDSGENAAVAWHHYNVRPMRIMLCMKVSLLIDEEIARAFWACILERKEDKAIAALPAVCSALLENIERLPDARSREIVSQGLEWARDNPQSIQIHTDRKIARQGHFPNIVGFGNLMDGLQAHSERVRAKVERISHDQQSEFKQTLAAWHDMFSNASPEKLSWAGEEMSFQKVEGSTFEVKEDQDSPGIQVADVVLWLYSQFRKDKQLPDGCRSLIEYVLEAGWENDFSFKGVQREYMRQFGSMLAKPMTEESMASARELSDRMEAARQQSMRRYEQDQLPPFMRGRERTVIGTEDPE